MKAQKMALIGTVLGLVLVIGAVAHATTITDGLIGQWMFNEASGTTAFDSTALAQNGTLTGAALLGFVDSGHGNVLSITGISGQVTMPYSSELNPKAGTITVWVKPTLATTADLVFTLTNNLLRCNYAQNFYAYDLRVTGNGSVVGILANDDPKTCKKSPQTVLSSPSGRVPLNTWTNIAMRWDGVGTLTVFANGKKVGATSYTPNPTLGLSYAGNFPLVVAGSLGSLEYSGQISDLRVYDQALSNEEIAQISQGQ